MVVQNNNILNFLVNGDHRLPPTLKGEKMIPMERNGTVFGMPLKVNKDLPKGVILMVSEPPTNFTLKLSTGTVLTAKEVRELLQVIPVLRKNGSLSDHDIKRKVSLL
jgi:hypothetical protein